MARGFNECSSKVARRSQSIFALVVACITLVDVMLWFYMHNGGKSLGGAARPVACVRFVTWAVMASWCASAPPRGGVISGAGSSRVNWLPRAALL